MHLKVGMLKELELELQNTPIELFRKNLESRFYTALAKNIIENVFGTDGTRQDGGTTVIDGYTITENWVGGSAPSAGGGSGVDIYTFNIIKKASGTGATGFTVIGNQIKTS